MLLHHFVHYIENELKGETLKAEKQCSEASVWLFTYVPSIGKSCLFYFYLSHYTLSQFSGRAWLMPISRLSLFFKCKWRKCCCSALQTVFRNPVGLHLAGKQHPVPSVGAQTIKQLFASLTFRRQSGSSWTPWEQSGLCTPGASAPISTDPWGPPCWP